MVEDKTICSEKAKCGICLVRVFVVAFFIGVLIAYNKIPSIISASFVGFASALFVGLFVGPISKWSSSGWDAKPPERTDGKEPVEMFSKPNRAPGPLLLGLVEVCVLYASFLVGAWAVVGGWFVFKAASKWAAWQHIMRIPDQFAELDNIDYLRYRHAKSSSLLYSFLVGTLSNVGTAYVGLAVKNILDC